MVYCDVCGREVEQKRGPKGQGRPREQHDECGKLERDLRRVETSLLRVTFDQSERGQEARARLRSRLWTEANGLNPQGGWTKRKDEEPKNGPRKRGGLRRRVGARGAAAPKKRRPPTGSL